MLDLGDRRRARDPVALLLEHLVVRVEVAQVVGGDRAELVEQSARQLDLRGECVAVGREQDRQHVLAVQAHRAHPRQVVEADLVDDDPLGLDPEQPRERALEPDRDVAQADRAVAGVEQRAGDDPDRVREVDDPRAGRGPFPGACRDLEHDRHRAKRLGESPGSGRLLPDTAAREGHRLVPEPRGLAADPDLDQHEVGAVERPVEIAGPHEVAGEPLPREHPRRQRADDVEALRVDLVQRDLRHVEPREPRHELRCIGRARADDCDLHPFTPVSVTPSTKALCARKKSRITGAIASRVAAIVRFHCTWCSERN